MSNYSATGVVFAVQPGDLQTLWDAETLTTGDKSRQVNLPITPWLGQATKIAIDLKFSTSPGTFQFDVQTADEDAEVNYVTEPSLSSNSANSNNAARIEGEVKARFARVIATDAPDSGTTTCKISR